MKDVSDRRNLQQYARNDVRQFEHIFLNFDLGGKDKG
jgi:hypothetical protein